MTNTRRPSEKEQQQLVNDWNDRYPVGTEVAYWNLPDEKFTPRFSKTRTQAELLGGHTAVVWLDGVSGCWRLTHISPAEYKI
jgi:hypothetical protein